MRTGLDLLIRLIAVGICVLVMILAAQGLEPQRGSGPVALKDPPAHDSVPR